eukprot:TRINITY_DN1133_c0_g1_i2.p1 TRINITY_DN1133_c0_g1~~TRINITY_DN1133_c0_g1_i2.p1  ORF type:complete len:477 (-),score=73.46 TRINITY_DN1133_c0_g1_i2:59-1489(-)
MPTTDSACPEKYPKCWKNKDCVTEYCSVNDCRWSQAPTPDTDPILSYNFIDGVDNLGKACNSDNYKDWERISVIPVCAHTGTAYNDPLRRFEPDYIIKDGDGASKCQSYCQVVDYCEYFTWYSNSGGCWLQGGNSTLMEEPHEHVVAGPKACTQLDGEVKEAVPCLRAGLGYNDPGRNDTANGAKLASAALCQLACQNRPFCEYFTWYSDTGGCWLQGTASELTVQHPHVYSGPVRCVTTTPLVTVVINDSEPALEATPPPPAESSGMPVWAWILIIAALLALIGCCAAAALGLFKRKKKTGDLSKKSRSDEEAANVPIVKRGANVDSPSPYSDEANRLFDQLDVDGNGYISKEEFQRAQMISEAMPMLQSQGAPVIGPSSYTSYTLPTTTYVSSPVMQQLPTTTYMSSPVMPTAVAPIQTITSVTRPQMVPTASAAVATTCAACGNIFAPDSNFCRKCGTARPGRTEPMAPMPMA